MIASRMYQLIIPRAIALLLRRVSPEISAKHFVSGVVPLIAELDTSRVLASHSKTYRSPFRAGLDACVFPFISVTS